MDPAPLAAVQEALASLASRFGLTAAAREVDGWGREAEHVAGRSAAAAALMSAGSVDTSVRGPAGAAPRWPDSWAGSISHTADVAIAVVASGEQLIGVDVEYSGALPEADAEFVLNSDERDGRATLRWSAKESAYKAWSRLGIDPVDPLDIHTAVDLDCMRADGLGPSLVGGWCEVAGFVLTLLVSHTRAD